MAKQWIDFTRNSSYSATIFCLPYSGGSAQVFLAFPKFFPASIRVMAFEPPGRGRRFVDTLAVSLDELTRDALSGFEDLAEGKPYYIFGHSLGGLLGYEIVCALGKKGFQLPSHLFVSGVRAPRVPRREGITHDLPFDRFVEKLAEMGGTHQEIMNNREMLELMVPILKSDFRCYETYQPRAVEPLACSLSALGGTMDRFVTAPDIGQWSVYTASDFSTRMFPGGHFFLHTDMENVCRYIKERIGIDV